MVGQKILYVFIDEGGNLAFSKKGTKYFTLTSLMKSRPFKAYKELTKLKYDLIEEGRKITHFHACEDKQAVRDEVFKIIEKYKKKIRVDSLIVEKRKTGFALQEPSRFYPEMVYYLLSHSLKMINIQDFSKIIFFTDKLPIQRHKALIEKSIKTNLNKIIPNIEYAIFHQASNTNSYLQMVDYINWAIFRKWESNDLRSYALIKSAIMSEFDIFRTGTTQYY